jgi:hypothetical protein
MRSTFDVMQAVKDGTEATEEELRYALHNVACWHALHLMDFAAAGMEGPLPDSARRGLQRAWTDWQNGNKVPLDKRLKGTSQEPGVPQGERLDRWVKHTSETAVRLASHLADLRDR